MREWLVLLAVGVGTYAARAAFLVILPAEPSPLVSRALAHVPAAVLAAVTVPALAAPGGEAGLTTTVPALAAAAVCFAVWRRTSSFPGALLTGLLTGVAVRSVLILVT